MFNSSNIQGKHTCIYPIIYTLIMQIKQKNINRKNKKRPSFSTLKMGGVII